MDEVRTKTFDSDTLHCEKDPHKAFTILLSRILCHLTLKSVREFGSAKSGKNGV